jgi:hypothetical protein
MSGADTAEMLSAADGERIAYHRTAGRTPGGVFLTGYKSDLILPERRPA